MLLVMIYLVPGLLRLRTGTDLVLPDSTSVIKAVARERPWQNFIQNTSCPKPSHKILLLDLDLQ